MDSKCSWGFLKPLMAVSMSLLYAFHEDILYPKKVVIPNPKVEDLADHTLWMSRPVGLLRVRVRSARGLHIVGAFGLPPDPYCQLQMDGTAETAASRSRTAWNTSEPEWDHLCEFAVTEVDLGSDRELSILVRDYNVGTEDDDLAYVTLSVAAACVRERVDAWLPLIPLEGAAGAEIRLESRFLRVTNDREASLATRTEDPRGSHAVLGLLIYEARLRPPYTPMVVLKVISLRLL